MLSTPILNLPQSGVLGMHNIVDRPIVVDGEIKISPIMYFALSYDHRIIDGKESVSFLRMIKETLSNKLIKKPKLEDSVKEFVFKNAIKGNPDSVLSVMDQFALKERFLMNVGDV